MVFIKVSCEIQEHGSIHIAEDFIIDEAKEILNNSKFNYTKCFR